jgi:hypothetical protein
MNPFRRLCGPEVTQEDVVLGSAVAPCFRSKYFEIREFARDRRRAVQVLSRAECIQPYYETRRRFPRRFGSNRRRPGSGPRGYGGGPLRCAPEQSAAIRNDEIDRLIPARPYAQRHRAGKTDHQLLRLKARLERIGHFHAGERLGGSDAAGFLHRHAFR